ncbi:hypothetical protein SCARR_00079 [Pontiella sulfatireligans]|uniref:Carbohydrate-binding module family 96 domain-containing protein n=2 Tax=Pontiella sulfatireligans TaxID=2750658 RepID=A0A6C2UDR2_9BACT|nr:hypothetical protein SCARR_00079 [Pontiella sulfatireligans]
MAAPVITVYDRSRTDVSAQELIDSDNLKIVAVSAATNITDYSFKHLVQETLPTPTEWAAAPPEVFYEDLHFFRKPTHQWVRLSVTDALGSNTVKVCGLAGGILTGAPDEPILPRDYVDGMGLGFIAEGDGPDSFEVQENHMVDMKKAGFHHMRLHMGDSDSRGYVRDPDYFDRFDRLASTLLRHGLFLHIGHRSENPEIDDDYDANSGSWTSAEFDTYYAAHHDFHLDWWTQVAAHCRFYSHRLAYHTFLETKGGTAFTSSGARLGSLYDEMTRQIRLIDPARMLIYAPPVRNDITKFDDLGAPYADHDANDGVDTATGTYFFTDHHSGFAGGADWLTDADRAAIDDNLQRVVDFTASRNIPVMLSAISASNAHLNNNEYRAQRALYVQHVVDRLWQVPTHKISMTWLTFTGYYDTSNNRWTTENILFTEQMNGDGVIHPDDTDGDLISNADELTLYHTDPADVDSDGDNVLDTYECDPLYPYMNPNDPSDGDPLGNLEINADYDGDGMPNAWEFHHIFDARDINRGVPSRIDTPLKPADPADAMIDATDGDDIPNLWEYVLDFTPHYNKSVGKNPDDTYDHDNDGVSTEDEIAAGTWARSNFDRDLDGQLNGADPIPYVSDQNHVVFYNFSEPYSAFPADESTQGAGNDGTCVGGAAQVLNSETLLNSLWLDGVDDAVVIPATDLGAASNATAHLFFKPATLAGKQVLFHAGSSEAGMSIYLNATDLYAAVWEGAASSVMRINTVALETNRWYSTGVVFDGDRGTLKAALFGDNMSNPRLNLRTGETSVGLIRTGAVTASLGGAVGGAYTANSEGAPLSWENGNHFEGELDHVALYNRALNESEISLLARTDLVQPIVRPYVNPDADGDGFLSLSLDIAADTFVQRNKPTENYGSGTKLTMREFANTFARIPLLKFDLSNMSSERIYSARLHIYNLTETNSIQAFATGNAWEEDSVTWDTMPAKGALLATASSAIENWIEFDLSDYIASNGVFSILLNETGNNVGNLASRENTEAPYLSIMTTGFDSDQDGITDDWETEHHGSLAVLGRHTDLDQDGVSDSLEFISGTDPDDPASLLRLEAMASVPAFELNWPTVTNRRYAVWGRTNLTEGSWAPASPLLTGSGTNEHWSAEPANPSEFYQIRVRLP